MIKNLKIHDQTLFFLGSTGVLSGIFLTNIFKENSWFILFYVCILSIQIIWFFRSMILYTGVFICFFCLGIYLSSEKLWEIQILTQIFNKETVFFTEDVAVKGTLREKISENEKNARYILRDITLGTQKLPPKIGILLIFPDSRKKSIDDMISFTGRLAIPMKNDVFDYRTYLLLDNIYATTSLLFPEKIGVDHSSPVTIFIRNTRAKLISIIENIYPWESAQLLEGILIGERANLSPDTKKNFNTSGLTHIIAVSGFNITIILIFLSFLFQSFPVWIRLMFACICVGFFTLLVGPQISVLRASVFGLISYAILLSGKRMRVFSILLAVAVGFVMLDPLIFNYDISFHLSFLAVFWLLFFGDFCNRIFYFLPKWFGLNESLTMCLAAMIFTLPILVINFGQISLISPIANIAIVPVIPFIMLGGFVSMVISMFSIDFGILTGFPVWIGLSYILRSVAWFGSLPYAAMPIDLGAFKYIFEIGYFMTIAFVVFYFQEEET